VYITIYVAIYESCLVLLGNVLPNLGRYLALPWTTVQPVERPLERHAKNAALRKIRIQLDTSLRRYLLQWEAQP
jgi:hypothetical protein